MAAVLPVALVQRAVPDVWLLVPFLASILVLGLPHGALDHLVLWRWWPRARAAVLVAYVALAAAYLVVWFVWPLGALLAFVLLTWMHWGQGDVAALHEEGLDAHLAGRADRVTALVWRGGLPMTVPFVMHPEPYRQTVEAVLALFGAAGAWPEAATTPASRAAAGAVLAAVGLVHFARTARRGARRAWRVDLGESLLLVAAFMMVHPVAALGIYFVAWHALRHLRRLQRHLASSDGPRASPASMTRRAVPTTLAALAGLAALAAAAPPTGGAAWRLLALYLVVLAVLTLPHTLVVLLMDHADGLWGTRRPWTHTARD